MRLKCKRNEIFSEINYDTEMKKIEEKLAFEKIGNVIDIEFGCLNAHYTHRKKNIIPRKEEKKKHFDHANSNVSDDTQNVCGKKKRRRRRNEREKTKQP